MKLEREELYWYWLATTPGITPKRFREILTQEEGLEGLFLEPSSASYLTPRLVAALKKRANLDLLQSEVERLENQEVFVLTLLNQDYPRLLKEIHLPPPVLFYRGNLKVAAPRPFGMVGTRQPSRNGYYNMRTIARELAAQGVTIVSGMARGMDAAVHTGALEAGGKTIAVLGGGVDVVYPKENRKIYDQIWQTGLILSEYLPGTSPLPANFPARNRIISGLSYGVLLGEGKLKSGGHITVNFAMEQNRDVFALPGDISLEQSKLPNILIEEGAIITLGSKTILEYYGWQKQLAVQQREKPLPNLGDTEKNIFLALQKGELTAEQLMEKLELEPALVHLHLTRLELAGLVERLPGNLFGITK